MPSRAEPTALNHLAHETERTAGIHAPAVRWWPDLDGPDLGGKNLSGKDLGGKDLGGKELSGRN